MEATLQLKLAMLVRLEDFLRAYPFGDEPAAQVVARFGELVGRFRVLIARQNDGTVARTAEVGHHRELRRRITRSPLRHLAGIADGIELEHRQLAAAIGQPVYQMPGQLFLAAARSIAATVEANRDLLRSQGMAEGTLTDLTTLLGAYEQALREADAGRRAHTGARAEMRVLGGELMRMVRMLDGIVTYHHRDKPDLLGAWKSARNIAWPVTEPAKPAVPRVPAVEQAS